MNTGISADEACRTHSLSAEDFARMCNPDGSVKSQATTTSTPKSDSSKSLTVDNNVLYVSVAALVLVIVCVVILLIKRMRKQ